jgi:hypothetical protein
LKRSPLAVFLPLNFVPYQAAIPSCTNLPEVSGSLTGAASAMFDGAGFSAASAERRPLTISPALAGAGASAYESFFSGIGFGGDFFSMEGRACATVKRGAGAQLITENSGRNTQA